MTVDLASRIEHTLLRPDASDADAQRTVEEARRSGLFGVCLPGRVLRKARGWGDMALVTVVGFPHGTASSEAKAAETRLAVRHGADEIDMVADLSAIREGAWLRLGQDVAAVVRAAAERPVKVILEAGMWSDRVRMQAARVSADSGARFVKTATGFLGPGASVDQVASLRAAVPPSVGVKASGGIRTREQALALGAAGADRIGTSRGPALVAGVSGPDGL